MALDALGPLRSDVPDDFEAEVVSAFGEAFNNIAVHGFRGKVPEPVQIEVDWDEDKIVITFVDNGLTFAPESVAAPDLDELPEHGMGLFIIKSCMDEVDYRPGPPNVLRLTKRHGRGSGVEFIASATPAGESCIVGTTGRRPDDRTAEGSRRR
jgi:anti-sigma regulatory factor (Ser/Thr protein kinase)